jgi:DNA-binding LytR/AlgR family response regulator
MTHPTLTAHPTALIAEDEPLLAHALRAELARAWPELALAGIAPDGQAAVEMALAMRPQVLFLDIRMPGRSGLDAAEAIVEDWPAEVALPLIVFVTAYDQYAVQGFERAAVDYLLKPVEPARLAATCARLQALLQPRQTPPDERVLQQLRDMLLAATAGSATGATALPLLEVIQASVGSAIHLVPIDDVVYFEAADKYLRVLTADREYLIRTSLRELLPQLDERRFWQVHRGTVVQARHIAQAVRDDSGRLHLLLRQRPERLVVSRIYAPRFRAM